MEDIRAIFKCRVCGRFVTVDSQKERGDNPATIDNLLDHGVQTDHFRLHKCDNGYLASIDPSISITPGSEVYGVAELIQIVKV
jgi:hypothetical protein